MTSRRMEALARRTIPRLTLAAQRARFGGLTTAQATKLRDKVVANLSPDEAEVARAAWQALSYEARDNTGQPWQWPQHPEAVRFHLIRLLGEGVPLPQAIDQTRIYAKEL